MLERVRPSNAWGAGAVRLNATAGRGAGGPWSTTSRRTMKRYGHMSGPARAGLEHDVAGACSPQDSDSDGRGLGVMGRGRGRAWSRTSWTRCRRAST